jgi:hypothetical protein
MNEIDHFNIFVLCSGDVAADVNDLHENSLVGFSYIVIEDIFTFKDNLIFYRNLL